ncbi:sensor domain-containing diguanylate cyclase [Massilia endophytica]|uniref:sensor domain-containing diguanylate cyclase n=1 Tax=Massilia endophytica TaxID=2899220 RepID=UPI001E4B37DC|nr:diguanylate cyclase [Massilia endophytica]UGQ46908.1 diguanylate cyclase [Massilia endophytica]
MFVFWQSLKKRLVRSALPAAVFLLGLGLTAYAYMDRSARARDDRLNQLEEAAQNYEFLLRSRLEQYVNASRSLGAFFSASEGIRAEEFDNYIRASRVFDRLQGISSFGYLPRVPAAEAARFEAEAARRFPGYRIVNRRPGADAYFPLLYAQHGLDPFRADRLRGFDFSAIPDRWAAMQEAEARDDPVATRLHPALRDPARRSVVLIFSPVRRLAAGSAEPRGRLNGFIFATLYISRLFSTFDDGRLARQFDLEVFQDKVSAQNVVFDADGVLHSAGTQGDRVLVHRATLPFANREWLVYFYASKAALEPSSTHAAVLVIAVGVLLTLIACYGAAVWPRQLLRRRAMADLDERFAGFFENHPFAVYALDRQRRFIQVNRQMVKELGVSREALIGSSVERFIVPENREMAARHFGDVLAGNAVAYTNQITDANGRTSDLSIVLIPVSSGDTVSHVLGFAENITDRKRAQMALHESKQMLQLILDNIPQSVFWKDIHSVYQGGNRALLEEAGLQSVDELIGKTDADLRWKEQASHFRQVDVEVMQSGLARMRMQAMDVRRDGTECWIETSKIPLKDRQGKVVGVLAVTEDITARKYMEHELFRRANYDILTGLPNRGYFENQLAEAVKRANRRSGLALMYFDIDHFKQINDSHGHDAGDRVIRMFAQRTRSVLRESDFMARLGGDEFVLIAEGLNAPQDAAVIAQKLVDAMHEEFHAGPTRLQVTTSIGVAWYEPGMTPGQLVEAADQAMYDAKRAGRNRFRQAGGQFRQRP